MSPRLNRAEIESRVWPQADGQISVTTNERYAGRCYCTLWHPLALLHGLHHDDGAGIVILHRPFDHEAGLLQVLLDLRFAVAPDLVDHPIVSLAGLLERRAEFRELALLAEIIADGSEQTVDIGL